jgi:4-hydroxy-2-oxoglutarate aldolase
LSRHENIVGIKDTSGNIVQISEIVRDTAEDFSVFAGNAGYLLPALSVGARGATLALANVLPEECCDLVYLFRDGKLDEARELQLKLIEINFTVTGKLGVAGLKYAMVLMGYMGGEVRRPLIRLSTEDRQYVEKLIAPFRR